MLSKKENSAPQKKSLSEKRLERFREKNKPVTCSENPGTGSSPNSGRGIFRNLKPPGRKTNQSKLQKAGKTTKQIKTSRKIWRMINRWNNQTVPGWKKLNRLHGGNETKNYKETVGYLTNFLTGKLARIAVLPNWIKAEELGKYTEKDFYTFVDRYVKLCTDRGLKYYQRTPCTLKVFLFGNDYGTIFPSKFLSFCLKDPVSSFKDPNPDGTYWAQHYYQLYIDKNKTFTAKELEDLSNLCDKLTEHFKGRYKSKNFTDYLNWFFHSMKGWYRGWYTGTTKSLLSDGCWAAFLSHHKKMNR